MDFKYSSAQSPFLFEYPLWHFIPCWFPVKSKRRSFHLFLKTEGNEEVLMLEKDAGGTTVFQLSFFGWIYRRLSLPRNSVNFEHFPGRGRQ
jgi:hypothetical protein